MTYNEAKEYLEECGRKSGIRPGLMRMRQLLSLLGNPQESLRVVHLAGTNGKGSTAAYLAGIFSEAGYKTGRFASPAVFGTREIFLITEGKGRDGQEISENVKAVGQPGTRMISREEYSSLVSGLKEAAFQMEQEPCGAPTRFELETAMAFLYFQKEKCDIVIMEAGLGGAGDSTNILKKPLASVLTSISYDHCRFLGETIAEIAAQKAGIIKEGCPVFSYDQEVMGDISREIIKKEAEKKHAPLVFADFSKLQAVEDAFFSEEGMEKAADVLPAFRNCFIYKGKEYETALLGEHQCRNAALAIEVAKGLSSLRILEENIYNGIIKTRWPGRLEPVAGHPLVLLDGAHNPDAARGLAAALKRYFPGKRMVYLMGLFADKDYKQIIAHTVPVAEKTFCVTTHTKRALDAESLCREIRKQGGIAKACESISKAVDMAVQEAGSDGVVAAFGSLSFLRDVREFFEKGVEESMRTSKAGGRHSDADFEKETMNRINALWQQPEFQRLLLDLEEKERDRKYCRHGWEHIFAVARLMWIFCLENPDAGKMSKELVYAAAFLHDLGRGSAKKEHAEKSAELAGRLLPLCGYSDVETAMVQSAICMHGQVKKTYGSWEEIQREVSGVVKNGSGNELLCGLKEEQQRQAVWLSEVLLKADHDSRDCYACAAREGCYWSEERKVSWIVG